ncbi:hypothetical protein JGU71_13970 [Antrihabitans sp. YC3-6]|uniref:Uncharacterized protein n=1 Tax=Antrihabitans stalagmiti TaxID=2799499 RepID=A0A934NR90_9NOCA|nr:hypothetical protein [Antrihabitans stalagmiti]MBJ8339999.1 hypothetical protein [Antrihabitans stalagmiti]
METPVPLAKVVGQNVLRLRTTYGATTDEIATAARRFGLKWTDSRVSALEKGKVSPTLPMLIALCVTLSEVTQAEVGLGDLFQYDGLVQLTERIELSGADIVRLVQGTPADRRRNVVGHDAGGRPIVELTHDEFERNLRDMAFRQAGGEAELRAAASLNISPKRFGELAQKLWGRSFSAERNFRAGEGSSAQKRGRVARTLKSEMRERLIRGDN